MPPIRSEQVVSRKRKRPLEDASWEEDEEQKEPLCRKNVSGRRVEEDTGSRPPGLTDLFQGQKGKEKWSAKCSQSALSPAFTFRIEHRQEGDHAQHVNEERLVLFRSDQPGSIGKIVFSWDANEQQTTLMTQQQREEASSSNSSVHVLSVKESYRGFDFGGLLFSEAIACLRRRFTSSTNIQCYLIVKEDVARHGQLVKFYQNMGAHVKGQGRASLVSNNNDGAIYRRIPMQLNLTGCASEASAKSIQFRIRESTILRRYMSFVPVTFCLRSAAGEKLTPLRNNGTFSQWLLVEQDSGELKLQPTRQSLETIADTPASSLRLANCKTEEDGDQVVSSYGSQVWTLQFTTTGLYVDADPKTNGLISSKCAAFWETTSKREFCLVKSDYDPRKWTFYRQFWKTQTVDFVREMRRTYTRFDRSCMTLEEALDFASNVPADPFFDEGPSKRHLLFATAYLAKNEGYPDWVQFVALVHGLACVFKEFDTVDFDWTLSDVDSRIVGCKAITCSPWSYMRCLSPDEHDSRYNTHMGMYTRRCGLENVLLSGTSSEYMYYMLKHNKVELPAEAFKLLKLGPLVDWHSHHKHQDLSNDDDERTRQSVSDFYNLCQRAKRSIGQSTEMSDSGCQALWQNHYSFVVRKYVGTSGKLFW